MGWNKPELLKSESKPEKAWSVARDSIIPGAPVNSFILSFGTPPNILRVLLVRVRAPFEPWSLPIRVNPTWSEYHAQLQLIKLGGTRPNKERASPIPSHSK